MLELALLGCVALTGVFLVSGTSKLLDPAGTLEAVRAFGVPQPVASAVARLLPPLEIAVALLLAVAPANGLGAWSAVALLCTFTLAVAENLRRGRRPACHCFGRVGSSDISGRTVVRNLLLLALAAVAASAPPTDLLTYGSAHSGGAAALLLLAGIATAVGVIGGEAFAARRDTRARGRRAEEDFTVELEQGRLDRGPAPSLDLTALTGARVSLGHLLDGHRPLLLLFLSPGCGPCKRLRPVVARWNESFAGRLRIAAVVTGSAAANRASFGDSGIPVLLDEDQATAVSYDVVHRPSAVLVSADGRLLGPLAGGEPSIRRLLGALVAGDPTHEAPEVPAESLTLTSSPRPRPTVTAHQDDDVLVVTEEASGASAALDPVAALIWKCLDGRSRVDEIAHDLALEFAAPEDVVQDDVLHLVRRVGRLGLLSGVAPSPADDVATSEERSPTVAVPA